MERKWRLEVSMAARNGSQKGWCPLWRIVAFIPQRYQTKRERDRTEELAEPLEPLKRQHQRDQEAQKAHQNPTLSLSRSKKRGQNDPPLMVFRYFCWAPPLFLFVLWAGPTWKSPLLQLRSEGALRTALSTGKTTPGDAGSFPLASSSHLLLSAKWSPATRPEQTKQPGSVAYTLKHKHHSCFLLRYCARTAGLDWLPAAVGELSLLPASRGLSLPFPFFFGARETLCWVHWCFLGASLGFPGRVPHPAVPHYLVSSCFWLSCLSVTCAVRYSLALIVPLQCKKAYSGIERSSGPGPSPHYFIAW